MPTDYHCEACNLVVQIGWFHYHNSADGYWASTLGFCQKCGTIHSREHASDDALPDRFFTQPGPLSIAESNIKGIPYRIPLQQWRPLREPSSCGHCRAIELVFCAIDEAPVVENCPRCSSPRMKELYTWIT
jgi:hypothetical protein